MLQSVNVLFIMLIPVVLALFFFIYVDADRSSTYHGEKLRMKVKGVYMPHEKINIIEDKDKDKDYYIQEEEYFYEKEEPFNFTCEAVNFKTNTIISLKFNEKTMLSGIYLFSPLEAFIENKSITVTYKPSTEKSIICTTEVNSESNRKKEHTYVVKFNKKPPNETSKANQVETKSNTEVILYIIIILSIVIMVIVLIKMRRKQKKSQNDMRFDLIEGTNRDIKNDNQYEDQENKATTGAETSPQHLKYAKQIATYVNSKNSNNTDEKNHRHGYINVNTQPNGYENFDQDEWTSNSAYETLSHLYCEINH